MTTLLYILVYGFGVILTVRGLWRLISFGIRVHKCTAESTGQIIDVAKKRIFLSWPAMYNYFPIFEYTTASGKSQILAASYSVQSQDQIDINKPYPVLYDARRPSRFYCPEWDKPTIFMGISQICFGLIVFAVTLYIGLK